MRKVIDLADGIRSNTDPLEAVIDAANVAIEPDILWPADNAQSAIDELREAGNEAATHIAAASDVHGVTGDVVGTSDAQVLTNKDYDGGEASNTVRLTLPANDSASIASLNRKAGTLIFDTDRKRVLLDDGVALKGIGSGGGGGSSLEWTIDTNGPLPDYGFFQNLFKFIYGEDQQLYAVYPVPLSYSVGDQIKMAAKVTSPDTSTATLHFKTQTTLIVAGDHLGSTTNQRTSTNAELNLTMITSDRALALECDLTDADGKINSVSVSPGDLLIIRLYRDDTVATSTVPASFLPKTSEVFVP